jgi:signal transduction histidine kinase
MTRNRHTSDRAPRPGPAGASLTGFALAAFLLASFSPGFTDARADSARASPVAGDALVSGSSLSNSSSSAAAQVANLASLVALPVSEAARELPVRLEAVVTYCHPAWRLMFVADGTNIDDSKGRFVSASLLIQERAQIELSQAATPPPGEPANVVAPATITTLAAALALPVDQAEQGYPVANPAAVGPVQIADLLRYRRGGSASRQVKVVGRVTSIIADETITPWWNPQRLAWGAAGLGAAGLLALIVILLLAEKNRLLNKEMSERQQAEEGLARARDELEVRVQERTRELEQAKRAAEAASDAKSRFLAMMSHEIRTPLNGVTGVLHLLPRDSLTPRQRDWIRMAQTSADTLLRVIDDILDFSKVEAGKLDLRIAPTDLHATINRAVAPFVHKAAAKKLLWDFHLDPAVPRGVGTDAHRLIQILGNLLSNALKFTETGGISVRVTQEAASRFGARVRFGISDTGVGLSGEQQQQLFKPFSQVDNSTTRRHGGTGLGLRICKNLVELLGGTIGVKSAPGMGSTFWFELEFIHTELHSPAESKVPGAQTTPAVVSPPARVLLVEDNEINQELAQEMIQAVGCVCECVSNGKSGVSAVLAGGYDLVVMDCMMPEMDGYEAARAIRAEEARRRAHGDSSHPIPIIAMTANAMKGDRELCLAAGMDDYLAKPLDPAEVEQMVRRWLAAKESPRVPEGVVK